MNEEKDRLMKAVNKTLDALTVYAVEQYGYCHFKETYANEIGQKIEIAVYELEGKTYLSKCADEERIIFRDITAM